MAAVRDHFPGLSRVEHGRTVAFLDGPAGTQLPRACIDAMGEYLRGSNANTGGVFGTSVETDQLVESARAASADFLGAHEPAEIAFGPNMTTIAFALSRALARELRPADEIVLSRLDHDANIAPWLAVARDRGLVVRWIEVRAEDCTLDLESLAAALSPRTRIVAIGLASNAVGTLNDVGRAVELAHAVGAIAFIDAVHAAPHLPIDVSALRADLLVCSPYKFYGPHLGILYGRREILERIDAYRTRPAGGNLPAKLETGTQSHESLAGLLGTFAYLAQLGGAYGSEFADGDAGADVDRRTQLRAAMAAIRAYERGLIGPLLEGLASVAGLRIHGVTGPTRHDERVPTVAFTIHGFAPRRIAGHLAERAINVWDGTMYAPELMRVLGLTDGMVRVGLVHYNTRDEVERLVDGLQELVREA